MIAAVLAAGMCSPVYGTLTYSGPVEYSAGTGSNALYLAVDFDYGSSFVFKYQWSEASSLVLWDAIAALDAEGDLAVAVTNWGGDESPNYFIDDISYHDAVERPYDSSLWPYWNIFVSENGSSWEFSAFEGISGIGIQNNNWYSMLWTYSEFDGSGYSPVRLPGDAAIPEPATMAMLGLGSILAIRRK